MMKTSQYAIAKLDKLVKAGQAKISGTFRSSNGATYVAIDHVGSMVRDIVPVTCAPEEWR